MILCDSWKCQGFHCPSPFSRDSKWTVWPLQREKWFLYSGASGLEFLLRIADLPLTPHLGLMEPQSLALKVSKSHLSSQLPAFGLNLIHGPNPLVLLLCQPGWYLSPISYWTVLHGNRNYEGRAVHLYSAAYKISVFKSLCVMILWPGDQSSGAGSGGQD